MDNTFTSAARNFTTTENGHAAVKSTGSAVLDLYGQIGGLRGMDFATRVAPLVDRAVAEDKLLTAKTIFYGRDARGGTGERRLFRDIIHYAATNFPEIVGPNIHLIPEFGRWDDLYALVGTPLERYAAAVIREQFYKDRVSETPSLLGKWLKSCNTSSDESKRLGLWTRLQLGLSEAQYRREMTKLRKKIAIVESKMSANNWGDIEYDKIPSRASLIYRDAFKRHDEARYTAFIEAVNRGEKKINAVMNTPQDIVHAYLDGGYGGAKQEDETLEALWENLPDFVHTGENIICMVDTSGSMYGRPIEVSTGLGMYFAQRNRGAFHNLLMTFTTTPSFVTLSDHASLYDNLRTTMNAPWNGSTDLNLACEYMLKFAKEYHVPDEEMPRRLIVISDMEIDQATNGYRYRRPFRLHSDELKEMYERAGYTMPQLIYWNVEARDNHFQTKSDTEGVMLASGSSPAVFEALLKMKDYAVTPYGAMLEVLNGKRYADIRVA